MTEDQKLAEAREIFINGRWVASRHCACGDTSCDWFCICGNTPCDGLDCGIRLGRKKPAPKSATEIADIRARAWATRRAKYGPRGNNGSYTR